MNFENFIIWLLRNSKYIRGFESWYRSYGRMLSEFPRLSEFQFKVLKCLGSHDSTSPPLRVERGCPDVLWVHHITVNMKHNFYLFGCGRKIFFQPSKNSPVPMIFLMNGGGVLEHVVQEENLLVLSSFERSSRFSSTSRYASSRLLFIILVSGT